MLRRILPGDLRRPSYVTVIVSVSPGLMAFSGMRVAVHPHDTKDWCIYRSASPVFVNTKCATFTEFSAGNVPKFIVLLSNVISGFPFFSFAI